ncbi:MAG: carbohydrate-binding family 9-like protein [Armatimonadia bacterium]
MGRAFLAAIAVSLLTTSLGLAQQPLAYPCYRLAAPPTVDGSIDDAAWQGLPEAMGFHRLKADGFAYGKPTSFRIGWSGDSLYLAVRCREPFSRLIRPLTADGEPLWDDDSIEVFIVPAGADYFQLIANTAGTRWNGRQSGGADKVWAWTAKARIDGDDWCLEERSPFAVLGVTPKEGDTWKFNVARNLTCGPAEERFSSWAPVKDSFADVANFAALTFRGVPVAAEVTAAQQQFSAPYNEFLARQQGAAGSSVANGSFEDDVKGWSLREPGRVAIDVATATMGGKSIRLDGSGGPNIFVGASQGLKLEPATKYILRCDIKRTKFASGTISVDVIERDRKDVEWTYRRCGDRAAPGDVAGQWGHYELRFQTSDKLLESMLMLYNISSGATAWYDNVELVKDDGSDPGGSGGPVRASRPLRIELQVRNASAKLLVNGETIAAQPGQPAQARIREGVTIFGIDAQAQGPNPGVKVRLAGDPVTDSRWRVSTQEAAGWQAVEFDDNQWPLVALDAQGFMWAPGGAPRALLRQAVLWNAGHDGPDRCLNPLIKEWGISEGAMENLALMLYSHFPFALDGYGFIVDVPAGTRLLDIMHESGRSQHNVRPTGVATETTEHDGRPYTRYRISQDKSNVAPDRITGQFLPLLLEKWSGPERTTAWYYRRIAKGNFTELEQRIPVRVLPPINGRFCKNIMISQYCSEPCSGYYPGARFSPEHHQQHLRQSFQAGFNTWVGPAPATAEEVRKAGGRLIIWSNYPFYGMRNVQSRPGYRWLQEHPEARARYFEDSDTWEKRDQYCPSFVVGEGRAAFLAEVKACYQNMLDKLPGTSIIWSDWEEVAWDPLHGSPGAGARDGKGSWCFCDRCKGEFRKWANLPADAGLSDAAIFRDYKSQWDTFRCGLDGKVAAIAKQASNELGKPYLLYSWSSHTKLWHALKGSIDLAFPGVPGNEAGSASGQKYLDDVAVMFRDKVGLSRDKVMGQEFAMGHGYARIVNPQTFLSKADDYEDPRLQKREILRIVATLGGGVDLCTSMDRVGGMLYWIGEATRILATYEDLFHTGERDDSLAECDKLQYPDVLVLKRGGERLVLLFNEGDKPLQVRLRNKDLQAGQVATVFEAGVKSDAPAEMTVTIPEQDVAVVHIK